MSAQPVCSTAETDFGKLRYPLPPHVVRARNADDMRAAMADTACNLALLERPAPEGWADDMQKILGKLKHHNCPRSVHIFANFSRAKMCALPAKAIEDLLEEHDVPVHKGLAADVAYLGRLFHTLMPEAGKYGMRLSFGDTTRLPDGTGSITAFPCDYHVDALTHTQWRFMTTYYGPGTQFVCNGARVKGGYKLWGKVRKNARHHHMPTFWAGMMSTSKGRGTSLLHRIPDPSPRIYLMFGDER